MFALHRTADCLASCEVRVDARTVSYSNVISAELTMGHIL